VPAVAGGDVHVECAGCQRSIYRNEREQSVVEDTACVEAVIFYSFFIFTLSIYVEEVCENLDWLVRCGSYVNVLFVAPLVTFDLCLIWSGTNAQCTT
jgi:hypothetical protein